MNKQRLYALITGISLLVMAVVAGISMSYLSPILTLSFEEFGNKLTSIHSALFSSIIGWGIILLTDLIVSFSLFKYYQAKHPSKSKWMGAMRLIYSLILAFAISKLIGAYQTSLLGNSVQAYYLIHSFNYIWQSGLIIFGIHLILLAPLVKSGTKILKVLYFFILIAGLGYVFSNTLNLFIPNYEEYRMYVELPFIIPMVLGEVGLAIWMLIRGGRETTPFQQAVAS
ncbi:DUF4386 domain-containing protein [bacterium]|nr:DUF4386 domain-containing protein [bacterium]